MKISVFSKGMHVLTTGRAQAILSAAITPLSQIRERGIPAHMLQPMIGHSYLAPAISVSRMRASTRNVNLGMTLTTLASQAAPLHMGLSMKATVGCYRVMNRGVRSLVRMGYLWMNPCPSLKSSSLYNSPTYYMA